MLWFLVHGSEMGDWLVLQLARIIPCRLCPQTKPEDPWTKVSQEVRGRKGVKPPNPQPGYPSLHKEKGLVRSDGRTLLVEGISKPAVIGAEKKGRRRPDTEHGRGIWIPGEQGSRKRPPSEAPRKESSKILQQSVLSLPWRASLLTPSVHVLNHSASFDPMSCPDYLWPITPGAISSCVGTSGGNKRWGELEMDHHYDYYFCLIRFCYYDNK